MKKFLPTAKKLNEKIRSKIFSQYYKVTFLFRPTFKIETSLLCFKISSASIINKKKTTEEVQRENK